MSKPTSNIQRRDFLRRSSQGLGALSAASLLPLSIQKALAIPANYRTGTIEDVEHIVILMQENRSFDHYFGTLPGVRGFADPFPIPLASGRSVWTQGALLPMSVRPFHLNTEQDFSYMRVEGTPHTWPDAQNAWDHGRMSFWPVTKTNHSMGYFKERDIPFQFALANAFTLCDAYHCSFMGGTNTNRIFHWSGSNGAPPLGNGPAVGNSHDSLGADNYADSYTWHTYPERLQSAGISWKIYQDLNDNFTDNPLAGFKTYRDADRDPNLDPDLMDKAFGQRDLDKLLEDVTNNSLPQVSWIIATAAGSEHPGPSSPAQGADYTARVLEALTANPEVWSKTVFIVNFDENDGFFDHVPAPAVPSYSFWSENPSLRKQAGKSSVDTTGEYHHHKSPQDDNGLHLHRPYGLGARVPCYVISPWSKGGWVNSQVFDHTSILRFIAKRFGVEEPNISPWRSAVCGDLSSAFNFAEPDDASFFSQFPLTKERAERAQALPGRKLPILFSRGDLPQQASGIRPSRALPYQLNCQDQCERLKHSLTIDFINQGEQAAVFHVYDKKHLLLMPRRYTVAAGQQLSDSWYVSDLLKGEYDIWLLGPNGFHRHFRGNIMQASAKPELRYDPANGEIVFHLHNSGNSNLHYKISANAYFPGQQWNATVAAGQQQQISIKLSNSGNWYDFTVSCSEYPTYIRRFAGRMETGLATISDPRMGDLTIG
ncbi:phosphocholine-specific phospholipase C [Undibacterium parvum]|uniref:phospholipase C n=2 Tax=Undibacterium TaxID=401469 RepID=A0A6M4A6W1_9BURK|nr:phospholipase C, phosphocholine-specific [Undibacterium parvum]AZP11954.1 phospholipase C, phosphocholine-specific [Undibacterium parvum]QJQ06327.1 phospholipase C, phosphocholine-specific [Undibacterium piscinae]